jgi:hypothetical protein
MSESSSRVRTDRGNPRRLSTRCAHCRCIARVQSKKVVTPTYDELYFQCTNLMCGHTWKAALSFVHTISPSAEPREGLNLPIYARTGAPLPRPANDPASPDRPPAANDDSHASGSTEAG